MFYDVLIYKKPTEKEAEEDAKDELLHFSGNTPVQADSEQEVGFGAIADLLADKPELRQVIGQIKVLIRPFA